MLVVSIIDPRRRDLFIDAHDLHTVRACTRVERAVMARYSKYHS